jgi:putative membrane protein
VGSLAVAVQLVRGSRQFNQGLDAMTKASQLFSDEQRTAIDKSVAEAESKTSAEVVPVVTSSSGRYDRAEDIVGLWCALLAVIALWLLLPRPASEPGDWGVASSYWPLVSLVIGFVAAFIGGTVAGGKVGWLRRLFTPKRQMEEEVASRAREVFFDKRVHHTDGGTGLLIYVSLFERMATVIADEQVLQKLGQPALSELCTELTEALRVGHPADAVCKVIQDVGDRLALVLPRSEDDANQLSNALVTIDQGT